MATQTVSFHRILKATPDAIYRAFTEPSAFAKWLPPHGFFGTVHEMKAEVGGTYRMSFTHLASGHAHGFGGQYLELVPGARIVYNARFEDPNMTDVMTTTVTLRKVSCGTELTAMQEGIPMAIPKESCCLGWQESLSLLALLVEAPVPG